MMRRGSILDNGRKGRIKGGGEGGGGGMEGVRE